MSPKQLVWLGAGIGSTVGGYIPMLWGADLFSFSSIVFGALGAFGGIWLGWKMAGY